MEKRLDGLIDLHVHAAPDVFERPLDELQLAKKAKKAGYGGILYKCHHTTTADGAYLVSQVVKGIKVFGGLVLNHAVGGINPSAVSASIQLGAKEIWFPTIDSAHHRSIVGSGIPGLKARGQMVQNYEERGGITLLTEAGKIRPEVQEILDLAAASNVMVGTGHLSKKEILTLLKERERLSSMKLIVTHPEWAPNNWTLVDIKNMCDYGADLELCYASIVSPRLQQRAEYLSEIVRVVGPRHVVLASDLGQSYNPQPVEGMRQFLEMMRSFGIHDNELDMMTKDNPTRLLSLG
jgi:Family of unknown function (DUF6282)